MTTRALLNAKSMRRSPTDAEAMLWRHLRAHRLSGSKFRRQQPIGPYIVDFVCLERRIVIEVDGGQHFGSEVDERRDAWLRDQNFRVLRFWNNDVLQNIEGVLEKILSFVTESPLPNPSPAVGRGALQ